MLTKKMRCWFLVLLLAAGISSQKQIAAVDDEDGEDFENEDIVELNRPNTTSTARTEFVPLEVRSIVSRLKDCG